MKQIGDSNLYIISENEIEFKNKSARNPRSKCPACKHTREHPNDPSVSWNLPLGVGYCHHCNARFKIDNNPDTFFNSYGRSKPNEQNVDMRQHLLPIEDETIIYLNDRHISEDTARAAGICSRQTWNGVMWIHWVAFPFINEKGKIVNVQYKMADIQQKQFMFEAGAQLIPWNIGCIYEKRGKEPLYVTEGMMDALALMECGFHYVVSVPNGANSKIGCFEKYRNDIEKKFEYIVFAGDTDAKGMELAERFTQYFSHMDICRVEWKEGTSEAKDANEMLILRGIDGVKRCIGNAEMEKSDDITVAGEDFSEIDKLYDGGIPEGLKIGLEGFDELIHFQEGNLLLITGYPGSGKSTFVNYIVSALYHRFGWRTLFFSPEKQPIAYHEAELIEVFTGKKFDKIHMSNEEYIKAKDYIKGNIMFLDEQITSPEQVISLAHRAARCMGVKVLVIDPFVYLDIPAIPGASETQKIAEVLKKLMFATRQLNIFVILVAHPRKPQSDGPVVPSLYEVAGSANFYNFCDAGIIMERLKGSSNVVKITCGKARRPFNGNLGICQLAYDDFCGRYVSCIKHNDEYTFAYRAFDRSSWIRDSNPDVVQESIDFTNTSYIDPGEQ